MVLFVGTDAGVALARSVPALVTSTVEVAVATVEVSVTVS
jgi:hypothetical protein